MVLSLNKRLLLALCIAQLAHAHQQPTTLVVLDIAADQVAMKLHIPLNELELAFGHDVTQNPEKTVATWAPSLWQYWISHIHPTTAAGQPWAVAVTSLNVANAEQTQSGPFQEVLVQLSLTPPAGASVRNFVLNYDAILHQVVTHKALVSIHSDWASGKVEPTQVGIIAVDTGTARVTPLVIHLGEGSWWAGFRAMVSLGMQHIREGSDHLLFLLVLLLPVRQNWMLIVRIVTAFTLGHSLTLLAGALHWLALPQQPVEVLIAFSILVTAIHAIRPIFPEWEAQVAAGFGLVHGLAFATVLADLQLPAGPMALSIFGFNLGIELMQLFVIAMTLPWLILLSRTPAYRWVRVGGALLAAIASIGWIANRVTGETNSIERLMTTATEYAPLGILILAAVAIPAYLYATTLNLLETNEK